MKLPDIKEVKRKDQARQLAIDWQNWQSDQSLSFGEIARYTEYFAKLAVRFHLKLEFKENGII